MQNNAPTGSVERRAQSDPGRELFPRPAVHPDLAALTTFPRRTRIAPLRASRSLHAFGVVAAGVHDGDDLLDAGWVGGIAEALVWGGCPAWKAGKVAGERRRQQYPRARWMA